MTKSLLSSGRGKAPSVGAKACSISPAGSDSSAMHIRIIQSGESISRPGMLAPEPTGTLGARGGAGGQDNG